MSIVRRVGIAVLLTIICVLLAAPEDSSEMISPRFEEITAIAFHHFASPTNEKYLPETMGSGVGIVDVDNDGLLDLFLVNGADFSTQGLSPRKTQPTFANRLYRNLGNWRFEDVTDKWGARGEGFGMGVAVGDYNNDGRPDLYITAFGRNYLYRNTGSKFTEVAIAAGVAGSGWSSGAAFLDYDHDGLLDLFVARYLDWSMKTSRWCGEGDGAPRSYCHPREFGKVPHMLFRNRGDGTFEDVTQKTGIDRKPGKGLGVKIDDVNRDGWPDILVANDSVAQQLFLNRSGQSFEEIALKAGLAYDDDGNPYAGMGIDVADVDGDTLPDVIINALARQGYWLYKNTAENSRFVEASMSSGLHRITDMNSGWGMRLADFDNDGSPDLAVAQGHVMDTIEFSDPGVRYREAPLLAKNVFGKFFDVSAQAGAAFSSPQAGRGLATGDLDGDGRLDLIINNNNSPVTLLRNTTPSRNNWLDIKLEGTTSNRDAYGAEITVTTDGGRRLRAYADTSGSYLSSSSPFLHFGLGPSTKASRIEVIWPKGARSVWRGDAANRLLRLREPNKNVRNADR